MTHIILSGTLTMQSSNGDGPLVLEQAQAVYAALLALGATPVVEITIRTQDPASAVIVHALPAPPPEPPAPDPLPPAQEEGSLPPEALEAGEVVALLRALESGAATWRKLPKEQRKAVARAIIPTIVRRNGGQTPSMSLFDDLKPRWMPTSQALWLMFDRKPWSEIACLG